jgi:hypothetical protein
VVTEGRSKVMVKPKKMTARTRQRRVHKEDKGRTESERSEKEDQGA